MPEKYKLNKNKTKKKKTNFDLTTDFLIQKW